MGIDLVTGGAGFIGSHLAEALIAAGRHLRIVDNFANGRAANLQHLPPDSFEMITGDIADPVIASRAVAGVDRVFHLAALADIVPSIEAPDAYFHANVTGTFTLAEAARRQGVRRFVYAASSSCYGIPDSYPTPEDAPARPQYPYALTKYMAEQQLLHWHRVYDLPVISLRFFNVYGPRSRTGGTYGAVFGVFLAQLLAGKPLTVVGDGSQRRDFTYVGDVAAAMIAAAEQGRCGEIYNVGSGRAVSVNELVRLLGARETLNIPKRPGEPDCTLADIGKILAETDWRPRVSIGEGVQIMLENIDYWRDAPVWTAERIAEATRQWFDNLGREEKDGMRSE